jgi:hypothetical protein
MGETPEDTQQGEGENGNADAHMQRGAEGAAEGLAAMSVLSLDQFLAEEDHEDHQQRRDPVESMATASYSALSKITHA